MSSQINRLLTRRSCLTAHALGFLSLSFSDSLRCLPSAVAFGDQPPSSRGAIFIFLDGGPSHLDTFDLKPNAPAEVRGEFSPIASNVSGLDLCELLPKLARQADKFALLRSVAHTQAEHTLGQRFLTTGNSPNPAISHPVYGSVVSRERSSPAGVPPFVSLSFANAIDIQENRVVDSPGYLGTAASPFQVKLGQVAPRNTPKGKAKAPDEVATGQPIDVRALNATTGLSTPRLEARHRLLHRLDTGFRDPALVSPDLAGRDRFYQQAEAMLQSPRAREAFDLSREPPETLDAYGRTSFGQSCLLARRLIEAGVRFVSINFPSWDAHGQIFPGLRRQLPELDAGIGALLHDLAQRGRLNDTAVLVTGEFGRTPKINGIAGRDHWSRAMSILMAGANIRGGQVIGQTNAQAEEPTTTPIQPEDIAASLYQALSIDFTKEYHTTTGRPIQIVRGGQVIPELFS